MEHILRSSSKIISPRYKGILAVLFIGVLAVAISNNAFDLRTTAFAAQLKPIFSSDSNTLPLNVPHRIYIEDWDHIAVIDSDTGKVIHQIPLGQFAYDIGVSLAVDPNAGRLFVTDTQLNSKNQAIDTLTVYHTSDWSIEQRIPVPNIVLYFGNNESSIVASPDGKYLYVYNSSTREQKGLEPVRYWLSVLDLNTWTWLPHNIDLFDCGAAKFFPTTPNQLYVVCYDSSDVKVVDVGQQVAISRPGVIPAQSRSKWSLIGVSSATVRNGTMYLVTENREIHIKNPFAPQPDRILMGAASAVQQMAGDRVAAQTIVPFQPIELSNDDHYLLVPTGTEEERSHGNASELAILSTDTGEVIKTLHTQPFLWITFASDGLTAFTVVANPDAPKHYGIKLVRLDLASGAETEILNGAILPGMVITP